LQAAVYIIIAAAVFFLIWLVWRLASRRSELPCPSWLGWMVEMDNPFTRVNRAAVILGHLDLCPGMPVLDLGCGPGRLTIPAAKQVGPTGHVIAIDVQPEMLARVEAKARAAGLGNIRFMSAAAGKGEIGPLMADRALMVTVLGEIPDREAALRDVRDALAPEGILSVTELIFDPHFQPHGTVRALAAAAGFRETAVFGHRLAYTLHFRKHDG